VLMRAAGLTITATTAAKLLCSENTLVRLEIAVCGARCPVNCHGCSSAVILMWIHCCQSVRTSLVRRNASCLPVLSTN
jgi:hypothetical protein